MTHPLARLLMLLSPRRRRDRRTADAVRRPVTRADAPTRVPGWTASGIAAAVLVAAPTRAQGEPSPVPSDTSSAAAPRAAEGSGAPAPRAKCEPLPPFAGGKEALLAAGAALVARGKQLVIGSPAHTAVKIELMTLFARAGDREMCKLLRQTRRTRALSEQQAHAIACVQQQFCRPMALVRGCPAGMHNEGPEGCAPRRSCTAAGVDAQVAACEAGDTGCCAPALLVLEIADVEAGMPTDASLARRRALAKLGCEAGHAELCLEAAALGVGEPAAQRERACSLGHVGACSPQ